MMTNRVTTIDKIFNRCKTYMPSLMLRIVIALIISWLIMMAFFVTGVVSN